MSTVRSARNKDTDKFSVQCFDWNGKLFSEGAFHTIAEADDFAAWAERAMTLAMQLVGKLGQDEAIPDEQLEAHYDLMTDDELLAELLPELPARKCFDCDDAAQPSPMNCGPAA